MNECSSGHRPLPHAQLTKKKEGTMVVLFVCCWNLTLWNGIWGSQGKEGGGAGRGNTTGFVGAPFGVRPHALYMMFTKGSVGTICLYHENYTVSDPEWQPSSRFIPKPSRSQIPGATKVDDHDHFKVLSQPSTRSLRAEVLGAIFA